MKRWLVIPLLLLAAACGGDDDDDDYYDEPEVTTTVPLAERWLDVGAPDPEWDPHTYARAITIDGRACVLSRVKQGGVIDQDLWCPEDKGAVETIPR